MSRFMWTEKLDNRAFKIIICEIKDGMITFEGLADLHFLGAFEKPYPVDENNEIYPMEWTTYPAVERDSPEEADYVSPRRFYVQIPLHKGLSIKFLTHDSLGESTVLVPALGKFARVVNNMKGSYFFDQGWLVQYDKGIFTCKSHSRCGHLRCEAIYLWALIRNKHRKTAWYRILFWLSLLVQRKPVWLVCDRTYLAGDNGEHMFRYLQKTDAVRRNRIYFVLQKDSPDFARLKSTGRVLKYGSLQHKIRFLQSRLILGSTFNELMTNVFGKTGIYYRDLRRFGFVFLRHGVSHNDQSRWINRLRLNVRLLIASCRPEYEGILAGNYSYTEDRVKMTGLPRFDQLCDEREKKIAILPTWRRDLQGEIDSHTLKRGYLDTFRDSEYFAFYDGLIHDERLLKAMEEMEYTGEFYLHPVFEQQERDFSGSSRITIGKGTADYQKVFRECGIMVTDYSSVAFDFAYLKKPVIYAQFDEETFFQKHSYGKGYFSYREDGFGPITATIDETVDQIIYYMMHDCRLEEEYLERIERFFAFTDRNNCRRVYEELCKIE